VADGAQQDAIPPGDRRGGLARLSGAVDKNGRSPIFLQYPVQYEIRGVQVALETRWDWEAEAGDDRHTGCYCGSRARLELRHGAEEGYRSELYVVPTADIAVPLEHRVAALQAAYPGIGLTKHGPEWRVIVPDALRIGHEAHFAQM
jgi:hypothetical protein